MVGHRIERGREMIRKIRVRGYSMQDGRILIECEMRWFPVSYFIIKCLPAYSFVFHLKPDLLNFNKFRLS